MKKPKKKKHKIKNSLSNPPTFPELYQEGLGSWTNDAVFSRLQDYGLTMDESAFRQEAEKQSEPAELAAVWSGRINRTSGRWEDFFQLATRELWKRLLPERDYWEWFFDDLEDQLELEDSADYRKEKLTEENVSKIINFLERLNRLFLKTSQKENIPLETLGKNLSMRFDFDLLGWLLDIPFELARDGFVDQAVYVARKFSFVDPGNLLGDLGYILAKAGRCSEALEQIENNLKNLSADPWIIIKAGDVCDLCGDSKRAEKLYLQVLDMTDDQYNRDGAIERLIPLFEKMGKEEEIKALEKKEQSREQKHNESIIGWPGLPETRAGAKIGRNDPCPCGSGKKYKKCCLGKIEN